MSGTRAHLFTSHWCTLSPSQITTLSNGLRVATQQTHHETATVGVFVDSGSRFETDETNGVANFVEHLIYKGTGSKSQVRFVFSTSGTRTSLERMRRNGRGGRGPQRMEGERLSSTLFWKLSRWRKSGAG